MTIEQFLAAAAAFLSDNAASQGAAIAQGKNLLEQARQLVLKDSTGRIAHVANRIFLKLEQLEDTQRGRKD